jgi:hypothetical protein
LFVCSHYVEYITHNQQHRIYKARHVYPIKQLERLHIDEALVAALPIEDQRLVLTTLAKVSGVSSLLPTFSAANSHNSLMSQRQPWGKHISPPTSSTKLKKSDISSTLRKEASGVSVLLGSESSKCGKSLGQNPILETPKVSLF